MGLQTMQFGQRAVASNHARQMHERQQQRRISDERYRANNWSTQVSVSGAVATTKDEQIRHRASNGDDTEIEAGRESTSGSRRGSFMQTMKAQNTMNHLQTQLDELADFDKEQEEDKQGSTPHERTFNVVMGGIITVNVLWFAIEMDFGPEEDVDVSERMGWWLISTLFLLAFLGEICVRMYWERWNWIYHGWSWFDLSVVICGIVDVWIFPFLENSEDGSLRSLSILRLLRLIRLVRMVKLVKTLQGLYVMVMAFIHALQSMMFLGTIMFFGMLIYAIFATMIIGRNSSFDDVRIGINDDTVYDRFGTVARSMYSLFELMTLEGFEMVARPLVEKQPATFLLIGSFIMIFTYGLLNMVVATVVEKTLEQTNAMKEYEEKKKMKAFAEELNSMKNMFEEVEELAQGQEKQGWISFAEFEKALTTNQNIKKILEGLGVPVNDAKELFAVLDFDGDGHLTIAEFVDGIGKLKDGQWEQLAMRADVQITKTEVHRVRRHLDHLVSKQSAFTKSVEARFEEQSAILREVLTRLGGNAECFPEPPPMEQIQSPISPSDRFGVGSSSLSPPDRFGASRTNSSLGPPDRFAVGRSCSSLVSEQSTRALDPSPPPETPPTHLISPRNAPAPLSIEEPADPPGQLNEDPPGQQFVEVRPCDGHAPLSLPPMGETGEFSNGQKDVQSCAAPGRLDEAEEC